MYRGPLEEQPPLWLDKGKFSATVMAEGLVWANCIPVLTFVSGTLSEAREFFQPLHVQSRTVNVHVPRQEFSTNKEQEFVGRAFTFHISEASSVQFFLETASGLRSSIALLVGFSAPPPPASLILQSGLAHLSDAPFLQISGSTPGSISSLASSNLYG